MPWYGDDDNECFYCGKRMPEQDDPFSGFSDYCGEDCYEKQCAKDRREENA